MAYLRTMTDTIRALDPEKRPIWMYEPNYRDANSLLQTGRYQYIIGKGFYVNLAGFRDRRVHGPHHGGALRQTIGDGLVDGRDGPDALLAQ